MAYRLQKRKIEAIRRGAALVISMIGTMCAVTTGVSAQEQCIGAPVHVSAASSDERHVACSAAGDALRLLGRCNIFPRRPLQVHVLSEVRHPYSGPIFGLFDTKQERVLVTRSTNIAALVKGTPYEELPLDDFYRSLVVHEVVHGTLHQNLKRPATSHAAYEYPAYALQIEFTCSSGA